MAETYPIGQPGQIWGEAERSQWLSEQSIQRAYQDHVLNKLVSVSSLFTVFEYGRLSYDTERYPLVAARSFDLPTGKPFALITGGVHGYETSGVQGAIRFLLTEASHFAEHFDILIAPCISPWGYETINRWNPDAVDPNRSFIDNSPSEESKLLMDMVKSYADEITVHIDLHETTDTDNSEFRPALSARDNVEHAIWDIPDGFYLVGDTENPCHDFQSAIIDAVSKVTHIAPADDSGKIIGESVTQPGVINYATKALGLCTGFSDARFNTTTEVYPDSPKVDDENCILAQVAAITSGLDFVIKRA